MKFNAFVVLVVGALMLVMLGKKLYYGISNGYYVSTILVLCIGVLFLRWLFKGHLERENKSSKKNDKR